MITLVRGSVIDCDTEAIVNAANARLRGGGGIDGVIHAKAGPRLLLELQRVAPRMGEPGDVIVTKGHDLPQRFILHAVGPIWRGGDSGEPEQLAQCYRSCIENACRLGIASVGFCSISTGAYGYPIRLAAPLALTTVQQAMQQTGGSVKRAVFALFGAEEFEVFHEAAGTILGL